jgi:hypothetical protein
VLKLGQSEPVAIWLSVVVGIAALLLAALTDHPTGLVRIIPYWLHLRVDRAVGVVFVIALQIRKARPLVLLDPRCRCPAHDVSLQRA